MTTLSNANPTLLDLAKATDPNGQIAQVGEILDETNEILKDMTFQEGNLPTGHRSSVRIGLPAPTWRKLYGGVQPTKGRVAQVTDNCGSLEAYAEVDKKLADLSGNTAAFRLIEDRAHIEGMNQEMADTLFYGNEGTEPEAFTGLAPRFNSTTAANGENIILGGSAGGQTDNASIWLVCWSPQTVFGIVPKGSKAGLQMTDKGQVTIEDADGSGGRMEAYRTHYTWDCGLVVKDWRYIVRIPNIDKALLSTTYTAGAFATGANLPDLMFQAMSRIPNLSMGRCAFYGSRNTFDFLRRQVSAAVQGSTLTSDNVGGTWVERFQGIPLRRCDALAADETRVA